MALTHYPQKISGIYPFPHRPLNQPHFVQLLTLCGPWVCRNSSAELCGCTRGGLNGSLWPAEESGALSVKKGTFPQVVFLSFMDFLCNTALIQLMDSLLVTPEAIAYTKDQQITQQNPWRKSHHHHHQHQ